jgi:MFS family permease
MKAKPTLAVALIGTGLGGMPIWLLSAYSPSVIESLALDKTRYGLVVAAFFAFSALTGISAGRMVNRIGWPAGLVYTAVLAAIGLVVMGSLADGFGVLVAGILISALANSFSQPAANMAIAQHVRKKRQGLAFGIKQAALPLSTFLVGISVPLFAFEEGWRWAFVLIAILSLMYGLGVVLYTKSASELLAKAKRLFSSQKSEPRARAGKISIPLRYLAVGAGLGTSTTMTFAGFIVLYGVDIGLSAGDAAVVLAVGSFVGVLARVGAGALADRRDHGHLIMVIVMMAGGAIGYTMIGFSTEVVLLTLGTIMAFGLGWAWNGVFHLSIVRLNPAEAAASTGVIQTGMAFGATVGPGLFGWVAVNNFSLGWFGLTATMVAAIVLVYLGHRSVARGA